MLRLFDREVSGNCYKARLLLAFLDLPYERVPVVMKDGRNQVDDAYRRLNPRGQVPTLQDDGATLWGSTAILCYLAARYDAAGLWLPREPYAFAQVMQWLELAQNEIQTGLFKARAMARFGIPGDVQAVHEAAHRALQILDARFDAADWLVGDRATIADIACFPYVVLAPEGGIELAAYNGIHRWIARFRALDRFVSMPGI